MERKKYFRIRRTEPNTEVMPYEKVCRLIELYEQRRFLWDHTEVEYRNMEMRATAVADISYLLDEPVPKVIDKWTNLRTTFGRILKSLNASKSGSEAEDPLPIRWKYFKRMEFLRDFCVRRPAGPSNKAKKNGCQDNSEVSLEGMEPEIEIFVDADSPKASNNKSQSSPVLDFNTPSSSSASSSAAKRCNASSSAEATSAQKGGGPSPPKKRSNTIQSDGNHARPTNSALLNMAVSNLANSTPQSAQRNKSTLKCFSEFVTSYLEELTEDEQDDAMREIIKTIFKHRRHKLQTQF